MLAIYRLLLRLYPSAYRAEYADEMIAVLGDVQAEVETKGTLARAASCARESAGLLCGAFEENLRDIFGPGLVSIFSSRRLTMRPEFKFPKSTLALMVIILAGVMVAIDKARSIQFSIPKVSSPVGPIHPMEFTILPSLALTLILACLAGAIGWAILFALHRSGVHRLTEMDPSAAARTDTKQSR